MGGAERLSRLVARLLLVSLLLVPLIASGHHHASHPLSQPCASCVVTHHTVAVAEPFPVPVFVPVLLGVDHPVFEAVAAPVERAVSNRGPPSPDSAQST
jgi:hypothetical protein